VTNSVRTYLPPLVVAAVVTLLAGFAYGSAGSAARSSGKIAYVNRDELRAVSSDGRVDRLLRQHAETPDWSPDGRRLAFTANEYLAVARPGGRARVLARSSGGQGPHEGRWSPTGRLIAFPQRVVTSTPPPGVLGCQPCFRSALFVVRPDGSGKREVPSGPTTEYDISDLSWSPDGRRLAFARYECCPSRTEVWTVDVQTGTLAKLNLPDDIGEPRWSPNGRWFAYTGDGLWIVRANGTGARRLTGRRGVHSPTWSPDSRALAFGVTPRRGATDIYKIRRDGKGLKRLTRTGDARSPDWGRGRLSRRR
jgi:Tol biopolymer transport system component